MIFHVQKVNSIFKISDLSFFHYELIIIHEFRLNYYVPITNL